MAIRNVPFSMSAAAIEGFESQKKRLDAQIRELRTMLNGGRVSMANYKIA